MATPNDLADLYIRIQQAKDWLKEHDNKTITTAAKIFKLSRSTLSTSIHAKPTAGRGGLHRILSSSQEQALHQFI